MAVFHNEHSCSLFQINEYKMLTYIRSSTVVSPVTAQSDKTYNVRCSCCQFAKLPILATASRRVLLTIVVYKKYPDNVTVIKYKFATDIVVFKSEPVLRDRGHGVGFSLKTVQKMSAVTNSKTVEDGGCTSCHEQAVQEQENNVLPGFTDHDSKNLKCRSSEHLANLSYMSSNELEQSPSANRRSSSLPSFPIETYKREHLDGTRYQRLNLSDSSDVARYQSKPREGDEKHEKKSLERDLNRSTGALHWNSPVRSIPRTRSGLCCADSSEVVPAPSGPEETDSHIRDAGTTLVSYVPPHKGKKRTVYPVTQTRTLAPQSVMQSFRGFALLRDIQNDCTDIISNNRQLNFLHPETCLPRSGESYSEHQIRGTSSERQPPPFSRIRTISGYETPSSEEIHRLAREKEARKAEKKREYERSTKRSLFGHIHIAVRIRMPRQYRNRVPRRRWLQWFCCSE